MNNEPYFFRSNKWLYHFTKFDTAKVIIHKTQLKYSTLQNTNDACEYAKVVYNNPFPSSKDCDLDKIENEIFHYRQLSLSEDRMIFGRRGFDLQQMWGIYADKGFGVCLVFDKYEFTKSLPLTCEHGSVSYLDNFTPDTFTQIRSDSEIITYIKENIKDIFFNKRREWEHEQEYRIITRFDDLETPDRFHHFQNSLKYVILFNSKTLNIDTINRKDSILNSNEYQCLKQILPKDVKILIYASLLEEQSLTCYEDDPNGITFWNSIEEYGRIVELNI